MPPPHSLSLPLPLPARWTSSQDSDSQDERIHSFFQAVPEIFEAWIQRRESPHTQRAYRGDVMAFVAFMGWRWPEDGIQLLRVPIRQVLLFRQTQIDRGHAAKTINRRISSLSSFYKYLAAAAAELRLPVTIPNPAHAQFVQRNGSDPRRQTASLSASRSRQLLSLPQGNSLLATRDRALLKLFLYTGLRLNSVCLLQCEDFQSDGDQYTLNIREKGAHRRTIGLHFTAGQAITEYMELAGISQGPLFRPRAHPSQEALAARPFHPATLWRLLRFYFRQLPGGDIYSPHSLRATTATLLLESGEDISKVRELLGHRHITTTQIYDKRRRLTQDSSSHRVPL